MFTIADLKELIKDIPDNTPIVLQKDDEGNGYRYMRGVDATPNYFVPSDGECHTEDDLECLERTPADPDLVLVVVAF